jgi:hypothetical protein
VGDDDSTSDSSDNASTVVTGREEPTTPPVVALWDQCQQFTTSIQPSTALAGEGMGDLGEHATNAAFDPTLVFDSTWREGVQSACQKMRDAQVQVAGLSAPTEGLQAIKDVLLQGLSEALASEEPFLRGADESDTNALEQAALLISTAGETITRAANLTAEFDLTECLE